MWYNIWDKPLRKIVNSEAVLMWLIVVIYEKGRKQFKVGLWK